MYTGNCIESSNLSFTATFSKHKPLIFLEKVRGLWFLASGIGDAGVWGARNATTSPDMQKVFEIRFPQLSISSCAVFIYAVIKIATRWAYAFENARIWRVGLGYKRWIHYWQLLPPRDTCSWLMCFPGKSSPSRTDARSTTVFHGSRKARNSFCPIPVWTI